MQHRFVHGIVIIKGKILTREAKSKALKVNIVAWILAAGLGNLNIFLSAVILIQVNWSLEHPPPPQQTNKLQLYCNMKCQIDLYHYIDTHRYPIQIYIHLIWTWNIEVFYTRYTFTLYEHRILTLSLLDIHLLYMNIKYCIILYQIHIYFIWTLHILFIFTWHTFTLYEHKILYYSLQDIHSLYMNNVHWTYNIEFIFTRYTFHLLYMNIKYCITLYQIYLHFIWTQNIEFIFTSYTFTLYEHEIFYLSFLEIHLLVWHLLPFGHQCSSMELWHFETL